MVVGGGSAGVPAGSGNQEGLESLSSLLPNGAEICWTNGEEGRDGEAGGKRREEEPEREQEDGGALKRSGEERDKVLKPRRRPSWFL